MIFLLGLFLLPLDEAIPYIDKLFPRRRPEEIDYKPPNINDIENIPTYLEYAAGYLGHFSNPYGYDNTEKISQYYINLYNQIPSNYNGEFRELILLMSVEDYESKEAKKRLEELKPYLYKYK